jgi:hypothetical protein
MTWAEYQALPVAQRPKKWICTDRDYTAIPRESVSVTADGVKSYGTLLNELFALVDGNKVTTNCVLSMGAGFYQLVTLGTRYVFSRLDTMDGSHFEQTFVIVSSSSVIRTASVNASSTTFTNHSTTVATSGTVLTFYY